MRDLVLFLVLGIVLVLINAVGGCGTKNFLVDPAPSAALANDLTALADASDMEGCGKQLQSGLLFCRVDDFKSTESEIRFVGPISNCTREACVYIRVYFPDGTPSLELAMPKKQNFVAVKWRDLTHKNVFTAGDRGFWPFERAVYWRGQNGKETVTRDSGLIYLRVLIRSVGGRTYESLHNSQDSRYFVYKSKWRNEEPFALTTSGRTFVGQVP
jgi:hypothetical protein